MVLFRFVTLIIFTFSMVPTDAFTTVPVISTERSLGIIMASTPKASHDLMMAPKLWGSSI